MGMDGSSSNSKSPQQISDMFQKLALAFKTKTIELFADADADAASDGHSLLDSAEDFIVNQKVVVIKPDSAPKPSPPPSAAAIAKQPPNPIDTHIAETLISSLFATIASFKASYIQLQAAHAPFDREGIESADRAILSHLQKLSEIKQFHRAFTRGTDAKLGFAIGSCLESQVQENQSRLRTLETVVNRLQSEIDSKHTMVLALRQSLNKVQSSCLELSKKLNTSLNSSGSASGEVLLSVSVFESALRDARRSVHAFTKILIKLMKAAGWDLDLAAKSVHPLVDYAKMEPDRYALLSYVCLGMFQGFGCEGFGLGESEVLCNDNDNDNDNGLSSRSSLKQLVEHISIGPVEALYRNPNPEFSRFCEEKYEQIIHPTMESSIFSSSSQNEAVLCSWKSTDVFYDAFVNMASSIWVLHKLAFSFDPAVEIFQMDSGVEFSTIYMQDVTRRCVVSGKTRPKVAFTVVPGFKIGKVVIQSQVYLTDKM